MNRIILALALLISPAFAGKGNIEKRPACVSGAPVKVVEEKVWVFVPVHINIFKALATKCTMPGRVRWNGGCWKPSRIPNAR